MIRVPEASMPRLVCNAPRVVNLPPSTLPTRYPRLTTNLMSTPGYIVPPIAYAYNPIYYNKDLPSVPYCYIGNPHPNKGHYCYCMQRYIQLKYTGSMKRGRRPHDDDCPQKPRNK